MTQASDPRADALDSGRSDPPFAYFGGADQELGNFIEGTRLDDTCALAAAGLLAEIDGTPQYASERTYTPAEYAAALEAANRSADASTRIDPMDAGRKFLPANGACIYLDMGHIEVAIPEIRCAREFVAYWHAGLQTVSHALKAANRRLPDGQRIHVLVNSSDGLGHSFGQHLNFALPRRVFDDLFHHRFQNALFLAAFQASAILFTGQGKVGAENGGTPAAFQLSARADFFESICGHQTTHRRPLLNLRDQPCCGRWGGEAPNDPARLHVISFDANLAQVACFLKFGVMQLILDMICAGRIDTRLILDDPVHAFHLFSRDLSLVQQVPTMRGESVTALDLQWRFYSHARHFIDAGLCRVPAAEQILALWGETLDMLQARDFAALSRRLDWVCKLSLLQNALRQRPDLSMNSPTIKYLDHLYGSLDPETGLFWSFQRQGRLETLVSPADIEAAAANPPAETRAWTRAMLLRRAGPGQVDAMDWDYMRFRFSEPFAHTRTLDMSVPLALTRAEAEPRIAGAATLAQCLDRLGVPAIEASAGATYSQSWETSYALDTWRYGASTP